MDFGDPLADECWVCAGFESGAVLGESGVAVLDLRDTIVARLAEVVLAKLPPRTATTPTG